MNVNKVSKISVAILLIIEITFMVINYTGVFGWTYRLVMSNSMEPTISKYSVVKVDICDIKAINNNDIVCFSDNCGGADVIHRVVDIEYAEGQQRLITKGDNNDVNDNGYVTSDRLVGKIISH